MVKQHPLNRNANIVDILAHFESLPKKRTAAFWNLSAEVSRGIIVLFGVDWYRYQKLDFNGIA